MSNIIDLYKTLECLEFCAKLEDKANKSAPTTAAGQEVANKKWAHIQTVFERCHEYNKPAKKVG